MSGGFTNHYTMSVLVGFDTTSKKAMRIWREHSAKLHSQQHQKNSPGLKLPGWRHLRPYPAAVTCCRDLTARKTHASLPAMACDCQNPPVRPPEWCPLRKDDSSQARKATTSAICRGVPQLRASGDYHARYSTALAALNCEHFPQAPAQSAPHCRAPPVWPYCAATSLGSMFSAALVVA